MAILINDISSRVQYTATSGQTVFTVPFEFFENSDLKVYQNSTLKTLTTHYTVTGAGVTGGGTITLVTGAVLNDVITIVRDVAVKRITDFPTSGPFNIDALNSDLDRMTAMIQQQETLDSRSLRLDQFDTPSNLNTLPVKASRAGKLLAFDSSGNPIAGEEIGDYKGNWATATVYAKRDLVKDTSNNNIYRCNTAHTSTGSQPISTNADAAKWDLIVDAASSTSSASAAAASASAAATSATNAASSASSASSSASTATTQASNASTSASSASTSATNAASSASSASTSASSASSSASSAASSAALAAATVAGGLYSSVIDKSANYTVVLGDAGDLIRVTTTSGAVTITLPQISTVTDGFKVAIVKWTGDANAVNIARSGSDTINGATSASIGSQYTQTTFVADFETNQWFAATSGLGSTNVVIDTFSGNGSTTAFTLSGDAGTKNNTMVFIGSVYQQKSTYSLSGTTLTFTTAPPTGTNNIEVVWTQPLPVGTPSNGTVTPAKLSTGGPFWDTSGNVGIGTGSPAAKLDLYNAGSQLQLKMTATGNGFTITNDSAYTLFQTANAVYMGFGTNGAERMRIDSSGNLQVGGTTVGNTAGYVNSRTTTRAWVNFNGTLTGTITPRASYNVSSVTKNGTGDYTLNFTTALADANYAFAGGAGNSTTNTSVVMQPYNTQVPTTSSLRIQTGWTNGGTNDMPIICVVIFGN